MTALDGVRILDLSGGIAGPLGVLQLAEHGADVIKVEPPGGRADRGSAASRVYNRSRRSVTLDLKDTDGVRLFRELCATADVLVEAFAPGTMARLGLDYESLRDDFPRLVYCSVPAWPTGTRYADRPGYEALVHARTGQHWENPSIRPGPVFLHSPVASFGAMFLVPIGIMSALIARERTGRGQHVEVSLLQGVLSLTTQNWNWTDQGQFLLAKAYPGVHQAVDLRVRGRRVDPRGDDVGCAHRPAARRRSSGWRRSRRWRSTRCRRRSGPSTRPSDELRSSEWDRDELVDELHAAGLGAEADRRTARAVRPPAAAGDRLGRRGGSTPRSGRPRRSASRSSSTPRPVRCEVLNRRRAPTPTRCCDRSGTTTASWPRCAPRG